MCKKCSKNKASKKEIRNLIDIEVESTVIAKYNGLYTYAKVIGKHEELFHHVQFVDNTIVDSIKSYDILVSFHFLKSKPNRHFRTKIA